MKKIHTLVILLGFFLLSSCNLASLLNDKLGFASPSDRCVITVIDNEETNERFSLDLGNDYKWKNGYVDVSLDLLLENEDFAQWYNALDEQSQYSPIGLYDPDSDSGIQNLIFRVKKGMPLYVAWNTPLRKIRIYANNGYELTSQSQKPLYYDYYFETPIPYGEGYELSFSEVKRDPGFNNFISNLGEVLYYKINDYTYSEGGYHCLGFVDYGYVYTYYGSMVEYHYNHDQKINKEVTVNKWTKGIYLGWQYGNPPVSSITFHSQCSPAESFVLDLDGDHISYYVNWEMLYHNDEFRKWYESLQRPGYEKLGLSFYSDNDRYAVLSPNEPYREELVDYERHDLYVVWKPLVKNVRVLSNSGKNENVFVLEFDDYITKEWLYWEDFASYPGFLNWYDMQTNGDLLKLGLISEREKKYFDLREYAGSIYVNGFDSNNHSIDVYIMWGNEFSSITIYANNGTSSSFTYDIGDYVKSYYLSFEGLKGSGFIEWYDGLEKSGYVKKGLCDSKDGTWVICTKNYGGEISSHNMTLYVGWDKMEKVSELYTIFGTNCSYGARLGSYVSYYYDLRNDKRSWIDSSQAKELKLYTDNPSVLEIQEDGSVYALSLGKARLILSVTDYFGTSFEKSIEVEVKDNVEFYLYRSFDTFASYFDVSKNGDVYALYGNSDVRIDSPNGGYIFSEYGIKVLDLSSSGSSVAYVSGKNEIYLIKNVINSYQGRPELIMSGDSNKGTFNNIAVSESGDSIVCSTDKGFLCVISNILNKLSGRGELNIKYIKTDGLVNSIRMSDDGTVIVAGTSEGLWYSNDEGSNFWCYTDEPVGCVYLSSDKNTILYSVPDGEYFQIKKLTNFYDCQKIPTLADDPLYSSYFTASDDCSKILYNSRTGKDYFSTDQGLSWVGLETNITGREKVLDDSSILLLTIFGSDSVWSRIYRYKN